ncbi:MAG TPA: aspartate carbamoyltransferase [Eubacteriales bacterium]|nr:aspartate carbamoyltransferase [Eubacteriales bacterium]
MLKNRNLIAPTDFSPEEIGEVLTLAEQIVADPGAYAQACRGKILASLFYEPSTRTKFSFDAAMLRLGGSTLGFSDPNTSSTAKGETVADSARTVGSYADVIVVRHPKEGTARLMSKYAGCPVVNAGDGGHHHPTQTLTDLLTIRHYKGGFDGLTVGVCGDLKFGRTIHSLVTCLARYQNMKFLFISPDELCMPAFVKEELDAKGIPYRETTDLVGNISQLDVLYMSRVQRERFISEEEYLRLKDFFVLTEEKMALAGPNLIVMHPLPRVNEIAPEVDNDARAVYFDQVKFGMYVRMALIMKLLGAEPPEDGPSETCKEA